jgi:hypothetical protein
MEFQKIVEEVIKESLMAGGEGSVFGSNADLPYGQNTEGDARNVYGIYGGTLTRSGLRKNKSKKRKTKKKK